MVNNLGFIALLNTNLWIKVYLLNHYFPSDLLKGPFTQIAQSIFLNSAQVVNLHAGCSLCCDFLLLPQYNADEWNFVVVLALENVHFEKQMTHTHIVRLSDHDTLNFCHYSMERWHMWAVTDTIFWSFRTCVTCNTESVVFSCDKLQGVKQQMVVPNAHFHSHVSGHFWAEVL